MNGEQDMKTTINSKISIENPSQEIINYCTEKLIFPNPLYHLRVATKKSTWNIPKDIVLFEKVGDTYVLPYGTLRDIYPLISTYQITTDFKPTASKKLFCRTTLREYQNKALERLKNAKGGILVAPCGSGKTLVGMNLISEMGERTLWIADTLNLVEQAKSVAESEFINLESGDIGTILGGKVNIGNVITFATIQTLSSIDLDSLRYYWGTIVIDEAHLVAGTPTKLTMFYKVMSKLCAKHKYGLTATPKRQDGLEKSMFALIGNKAHEITQQELEQNKIRATLKIVDLPTEDNLYYYDTDYKLIPTKYQEFIATNDLRNSFIAKNILKVYLEQGHKQLVLCTRVEQCKRLASMLKELNKQLETPMKYVVFTGSNTRKTNLDIVKNYMKYDIIIGTYAIANKGLDMPRLDTLHLASLNGKNNKSLYTQSVGRIERTCYGKDSATTYCYRDCNIPHSRKAVECVRLAMGIRKGYVF